MKIVYTIISFAFLILTYVVSSTFFHGPWNWICLVVLAYIYGYIDGRK